MEAKAKVFKFGEFVSVFIGDMIDHISVIFKIYEDVERYAKEYLHEHPDEIDDLYTVFKYSNPSISVITGEKKIKKRLSIMKINILKLS